MPDVDAERPEILLVVSLVEREKERGAAGHCSRAHVLVRWIAGERCQVEVLPQAGKAHATVGERCREATDRTRRDLLGEPLSTLKALRRFSE